jgi:hypothetical protein
LIKRLAVSDVFKVVDILLILSKVREIIPTVYST